VLLNLGLIITLALINKSNVFHHVANAFVIVKLAVEHGIMAFLI